MLVRVLHEAELDMQICIGRNAAKEKGHGKQERLQTALLV